MWGRGRTGVLAMTRREADGLVALKKAQKKQMLRAAAG